MFGRMIRMLIDDFNEYVGGVQEPVEPIEPPDRIVMLRSGKKLGEWTRGTTSDGGVVFTDELGTLATLWRDKRDMLHLIVSRIDRWPKIDEIMGAYEALFPNARICVIPELKRDGDPYMVDCVRCVEPCP